MESGHNLVKRGISWTGQGTMTHGTMISCEENTDRIGTDFWEKEKNSWVKAKPLLTSSPDRPARKTSKYLLQFLVYYLLDGQIATRQNAFVTKCRFG